MLLQRECPFVPAGILPPPAPLPSLSAALARRAAIFGPVEADAAPIAPRRPWQALGAVARRIADTLDPQGVK